MRTTSNSSNWFRKPLFGFAHPRTLCRYSSALAAVRPICAIMYASVMVEDLITVRAEQLEPHASSLATVPA